MSWRASALLREAWLNVVSNPVRSGVVVLIAAAAVGVLGFLELRTAADLTEFQRDYAAAGGYVAVVAAEDDRIDGGRCAALQRLEGVTAAGAIRPTGTVSFVSAPGVLFQSAEVTEGTLRVWAPAQQVATADGGPAYVLGSALATELGVREGSLTAVAGQPVARVRTVLNTERRFRQVQRWLLDVTPPAGPFDECWVEFTRENYGPGLATLAAWFATGSTDPVVRPYSRRNEFTRDPLREFRERPQRYGWLAAGGLVAAVLLLSAWFRRAEIGLYLALGTARLQLATMLAAETFLIIGAGTLLAGAWTVGIHAALGNEVPADHLRIAARAVFSGALLGLALAPWLAVLVARGNIAGLLKDR